MSNQVNERKITYRQVGDYQILHYHLKKQRLNWVCGV